MAENLKNLNKRIARSKQSKKKTAKQVEASDSAADNWDRLVSAIENLQQPIVNVEARQPVSYRFTVDIDRSTGNMSGGRIDPIIDGELSA